VIAARAITVNGAVNGLSRPRLAAVDCHVERGEFVAVLGPNGAGKTTLLRVLAGDLRPAAGTVELDGRPLATWPREALARRRAVLSATDAGLAWPVREIVALGRLPHAPATARDVERRCVERAIAIAGLDGFGERLYVRLSAGEQARVQFARCLAQLEPDDDGLLLMDEPVAHADLRHQHALLAAARERARRGGAVLAILHDPNQALHYADRILLLQAGRVIASGPPREILQPALLTALYEVPVRRAVDADGLAFLGVLPAAMHPTSDISIPGGH